MPPLQALEPDTDIHAGIIYSNLTIIKTAANRRDFLIENEPLCFSDRYFCDDKLVYIF